MPKQESTFSEGLATTLQNEGGVDLHSIRGSGISNQGLTQRFFDSYNNERGLPLQDVRKVPPQKIAQIYHEEFYQKPGINLLPPEVAKQVFDFGITASPKVAIQKLQKVLGVTPDGIIGNDTMLKIVNSDNGDVINKYLDERANFYKSLAEERPKDYASSLKGWLNRVEKMRPKVVKNGR